MKLAPLPSLWLRISAWMYGPRKLIVEVRPGKLTAQVHLRWRSLSPRQQEVTILICQGYTNRQIAEALTISIATVKTHIRRILAKFDLHSKAELRLLLSIKEGNTRS